MKAIVTGGAGFVGSNIALELESKGAEVIVIDDFSSGNFKTLKGFYGDVIAKDVNEIDWNKLDNVDVVFHEAAITDTTVMDQKRMMEANVESIRKVLAYCVKNETRLVYASSAAVYGNEPAPQSEEGILNPLNIYGYSKFVADQVAMKVAREAKIIIVGLRYFNVFGQREQFKGPAASMIYQLAEQIRSGKRPRIFHDGHQSRDHIYVKDVVGANLAAMQAKKSGVVNVGTGVATSFNRLIEIINGVLGTHLAPDYFNNLYSFYQNKTQASTEHLKKLLGFQTKYTIEEGIEEYLKTIYTLKEPHFMSKEEVKK
ncbi:MAG: ADP-glyceromanno-heptose 6-epimerase [Omnitrophica bacterium RIFCSPLOWO2_12_FULL_44_17]|uniref:ADP-glyceromanno-heptose 6-epimerase n=1 Tax=Candidatus Danuiimicrobium aquiferis TaxID=1801832 RepID=A0A1G1KVP2_9BACT|nr:MAG: ADP-glyceromanno-heptose 6-epimerase [Omnitrophica bacterium RIFCSPHIGHO2_02_FULL_45_28]OGW90441.1 MAG: ADP-glyceromanno-heptose 6-epimerase [Omnitrophica bacterium RIFCSPHIGHO2_12_FULL_44_12]OGW96950.1 MAG: ADP-glyceromanno-heptose 6-epimerase [Omnitrophica bacterium RIFCSPLOWO2_12_FULL_44_17]OGX03915.1 MAG: ADP-glyceromanno-heptose 6-epimerase [Omnitrophica bacterium RIFCSPLOWO2_02_FULL_44_11]